MVPILDDRSIAATGSLALLGIGILISRVISKRGLKALWTWNLANAFGIAFLVLTAARALLPPPLAAGLGGALRLLGLACLADACDSLLSRRRRAGLILGGSMATAILLVGLSLLAKDAWEPALVSSLLALLLCMRELGPVLEKPRESRAREGRGALAALFGLGALAFAASVAFCAAAALGVGSGPPLPFFQPLLVLATAVFFIASDLVLDLVLMASFESAIASKVFEMGESKNDLQLLYDAFTETAGSTDLEDLIPRILDLLRQRLRVDMAAFYLREPGGEELPLVAQRGLSPAAISALIGPRQSTSLAWQAYVEKRASVRRIEDYPEGPIKEALAGLELSIIGGFPIALRGEGLGAMTIGYRTASELDAFKLTLLETLSLQLGAVVKAASLHDGLSRANARLDALASTDALTGLANRREASRFLEREASRASRSAGTLAVLMCDIDHFKLFNDEHGHDCGDFVLAGVAGALAQGLRATDLAARWGGEEFLVVLGPSSEGTALGSSSAIALAERLRRRIAETAWEYEGESLFVSVTIGVAICSAGTGSEEAVGLADAALYDGKRGGRDRVVARASEGILLPGFEKAREAQGGPDGEDDEASELLPV
jgi:diguanylate cyclase (GGDEF)-like protein